MKVALIGGHLGPALSIIEALPRDSEVIFIGRKFALEGDSSLSLEYKTITSRNIKFFSITTGRLQRKFTKHTILSPFKFPYGLIQSIFVLKKENPDVVLGFGGYVSLPVCLAAFFLKIPIVIHEQTLAVGFSNRIIANFAQKICVSWKTSLQYFPKEKTVLTGNPIRKFKIQNSRLAPAATQGAAKRAEFKIAEGKPVVYITGGSLGSHAVNLLMEKYLKRILEKFVVIHQTGNAKQFGDFDRLQALRNTLAKGLRERYVLTRFVEPSSVGYILQQADLVIGRCGINTITELMIFKKPSLLIPLLFSQRREQVKNALLLKNLGTSEIFFENEKQERFFELLTKMINNIETYKKNTNKMEGLIIKNAAQRIVKVIQDVCKNKKE